MKLLDGKHPEWLNHRNDMQKDDRFYTDMQRYIAVTTVGPSALRNQGSKGVIQAAQKYLASVDLARFRAADESGFLHMLDIATAELTSELPEGAQNWGAARKALNLFLRDICYNRFLCERYRLADSEDWMELPLDRLLADRLKRDDHDRDLPRWPGINGLTADVSSKYQSFAKRIANALGISRVHLDMRDWTTERQKGGI